MNEYYICRNCGQMVQGWNASQDIECCDAPDYVAWSQEEENRWLGAESAA